MKTVTGHLMPNPPHNSEFVSYRDIKATVLTRIQDKTWAPDTILPSEADLAIEFSCTRTTVNRAMRELADEGYIERKRKVGTRVLKSPTRHARFTIPLVRDEVEGNGSSYRYALSLREQKTAPGWLSARLNLPADQPVLHVICMHYANNAPFQYEDRWINIAAVPWITDADFSAVGPNEWLVNEVPFTDINMSFSAANLTADIAEFLGVSQGEASFVGERTTWLKGEVVTFVKLYHAPGFRMSTAF